MAGLALLLTTWAGNYFLADAVHHFQSVWSRSQDGPAVATAGFVIYADLGASRRACDLFSKERIFMGGKFYEAWTLSTLVNRVIHIEVKVDTDL